MMKRQDRHQREGRGWTYVQLMQWPAVSVNINATSNREKLVDVQGGEAVAHGCLTKARNHKLVKNGFFAPPFRSFGFPSLAQEQKRA